MSRARTEPHHMFGEGGIGFVTAIEYPARLRVFVFSGTTLTVFVVAAAGMCLAPRYARAMAVPLVGPVRSGVHDHRRPREQSSVVSASTHRAGGGICRLRVRPAARSRACRASSIGSWPGGFSAHTVRLPGCRRTGTDVRGLGRATPSSRLGSSAASRPGAGGVYRRWGSPRYLLQRPARLEFPSEVRIGAGDERGSDPGT